MAVAALTLGLVGCADAEDPGTQLADPSAGIHDDGVLAPLDPDGPGARGLPRGGGVPEGFGERGWSGPFDLPGQETGEGPGASEEPSARGGVPLVRDLGEDVPMGEPARFGELPDLELPLPNGDGSEPIGDGEHVGDCQPQWVAPLELVDSHVQIGGVSFAMADGYVLAMITTWAGWELGDAYLGVGVAGAEPAWVVENPTPWSSGWLRRVVLHHPVDAPVACGAPIELVVQANVREAGGRGLLLASALGARDRGPGGWADVRPWCCPEHPRGCTLTQGYWKNHPEDWPVRSLALGAHRYGQAELLALLRTPVREDVSLALAHQLIAAELNVAAGASPSPAIASAQEWLRLFGPTQRLPLGISPATAAGRRAAELNDALTAYNEGRTGPGHCDG